MNSIYVATSSPRRIDLLNRFNFRFEIIEPCPERSDSAIPQERVIQRALSKTECIKKPGIIVSFDTIVVLSDRILEKPGSIEDARKMLLELSGKWHKVMTGIIIKHGAKMEDYVEITKVKFAEIQEELIDISFLKYNPLDKAGSYGIQDFSGIFIEKIEGDYYNVVGLPLYTFYRALKEDFNLAEPEIFK